MICTYLTIPLTIPKYSSMQEMTVATVRNIMIELYPDVTSKKNHRETMTNTKR